MKRRVVDIHGVMTENVLSVSERIWRVQVERHLIDFLILYPRHEIPDREMA